MTFLNSALLAGLAAVALPLLIHLFSRRRFPRIDFSSLRFLKRLQRQQMRTLKLRQWLLLLLRTLAVMLIALGFTRPARQSQMGLGALSSRRTSVAIILDGSASLLAKGAGGTSFQKAKAAAEIILANLNPGDQALIVLAQKKPEMVTPTFLTDSDHLRRLLGEVEPWDGSADLSAAVALASQKLDQQQDFRREIYIISDFTSPSTLPALSQGAAPFLVRIDPESAENSSVSQVRLLSEILEPGQPVAIEIILANHGKHDRSELYYSVYLNDQRVAEEVVNLSAGGAIKRTHQLLPGKAGLQEVRVQIEDQDIFPTDNRAYGCFYIPERCTVLLVGDPIARRPVQLALAPLPESAQFIALQATDRKSWDANPLASFDVIIFLDPLTMSSSQAQRLVTFVETGGGLLLFPGSNTDVASLNRELLTRLETPLWGEAVGKAGQTEAFLTWQDLDRHQSLLQGIFRPDSHPGLPQFYQSIRLLGERGTPLILFKNGSPFLTETARGKGQIILCASSPDPAWSDWALRGIYAPLIHRLIVRLCSGSADRCQDLIVGDSLEVAANITGSGGAILIQPNGEEIQLPPQVKGLKVVYFWPELPQAGVYRLTSAGPEVKAAVNLPAEESDLMSRDPFEFNPGWREAGAYQATPETLADVIKRSRYGQELWKALLIGGFLLLLVESALGSTLKQNPEIKENQ